MKVNKLKNKTIEEIELKKIKQNDDGSTTFDICLRGELIDSYLINTYGLTRQQLEDEFNNFLANQYK